MNRDDDDDGLTEAVVAADDTGLVRNEIAIVEAEIEEAELEEGEPEEAEPSEWTTGRSPTKPA
jgi:hypothetical protein